VAEVAFSGLITGLLYALSALSLVIVYRSSRVMNFALGGIGGIAAFTMWSLMQHWGGYTAGLIVASMAGMALGLLVQLVVVRPLRGRAHIEIGVVTLGALLAFEGFTAWIWGTEEYALPPLVSGSATVAGVVLSWNQLVVGLIALAGIAIVFILVEKTNLGLRMKAVSQGPETADVLGINVGRMDLVAWALGGLFGGLAAGLIAPLTYLDSQSYTNFLFLTFVAIVLGGITDLRGVLIGGVLYGVAINLFQRYVTTEYNSTFTFIFVAAILVFRPEGLFGHFERGVAEVDLSRFRRQRAMRFGRRTSVATTAPGVTAPRDSSVLAADETPANDAVLHRSIWSTSSGNVLWRTPTRAAGWMVMLAIGIVAPLVTGGEVRSILPAVIATYIGVLGLNVVSGWSGQVSVCQGAFFAIGGYAALVFSEKLGVSAVYTLPLVVLFGGLIGLLLGLPATRLRSYLYLALLTTVFAFAVPEVANDLASLTGGSEGAAIPLPSWLTGPNAEYYFYAGVAALVTLVIALLRRSGIGQRWSAVRDSARGAESVGIRPSVVRVGAFAVAGACGALGGALLSLNVGFISPDSYDIFLSIYLFAAVVIGGNGSIVGSLFGAAFIEIIPLYTGTAINPDIVFGVVLVVVMLSAPNGVAGLCRRAAIGVLRRAGEWSRLVAVAIPDAEPVPEPPSVEPELPIITPARVGDGGHVAIPAFTPVGGGKDLVLQVEGIDAGYGGASILHDLSFTIPRGTAVAVIGANGAGKSTLLRAVAGVLPVTSGRILFKGKDVTKISPHGRTARGISYVVEGRGIFPDLSVEENLRIGQFAASKRRGDPYDLDAAFEWFPRLVPLRQRPGGTLSGGEQQMLAVARGLMSRPELLMLDEPSLGLAPAITDDLFERLRSIRETGISILLVEQNVSRVLEFADDVFVLVKGNAVMSRKANEFQGSDEELINSYLGVTMTTK
jgi:ABC-type branched-subunit amino acid transport system ATPase component/branched-subunit amino acid ABC-type transport system permease component